ncbi:hypothetical protein [Escherichia coli]|uniref:hypothetical protein n=1 Tax=Escherichia coli TaxID=562 RepID=UPI001A8D2C02|nr:hypothetical protein [Escherichia coli]MBO0269349.1 hypothetical protein [Escherichia coli]
MKLSSKTSCDEMIADLAENYAVVSYDFVASFVDHPCSVNEFVHLLLSRAGFQRRAQPNVTLIKDGKRSWVTAYWRKDHFKGVEPPLSVIKKLMNKPVIAANADEAPYDYEDDFPVDPELCLELEEEYCEDEVCWPSDEDCDYEPLSCLQESTTIFRSADDALLDIAAAFMKTQITEVQLAFCCVYKVVNQDEDGICRIRDEPNHRLLEFKPDVILERDRRSCSDLVDLVYEHAVFCGQLLLRLGLEDDAYTKGSGYKGILSSPEKFLNGVVSFLKTLLSFKNTLYVPDVKE